MSPDLVRGGSAWRSLALCGVLALLAAVPWFLLRDVAEPIDAASPRAPAAHATPSVAPVMVAAHELDSAESARAVAGLTLTGSIAVLGERPMAFDEASGTIELLLVSDGVEWVREVDVRAGQFRIDLPSRGNLTFRRPRIDGGPCRVLSPSPRAAWPPGDRVQVIVVRESTTRLSALDARTGAHLSDVEVSSRPGTDPFGHPGPARGDLVRLVEGGTSPMEIELSGERVGAGPQQTLFARAPGYAFGSAVVSSLARNQVSVRLERGGDLELELALGAGIDLPANSVLRLTSGGETVWEGPAQVGRIDLPSFPAGTIEAALLVDDLELIRTRGELAAGGWLPLRLSLDAHPDDIFGDLHVALDVPGSWPLDRVRLRIYSELLDSRSVMGPPLFLPRAGSRRVEWVFEDVPRGDVELEVYPMRFMTRLDHRLDEVHELALPGYVRFELELLNAAEVHPSIRVAWEAEVDRRRWFAGGGLAQAVPAAMLGNLPAARTTLTLTARGHQPAQIVVEAYAGSRSESVLLAPEPAEAPTGER
ncbi:hypothetical protein [Engelhardtia mirabilis]|uniref:Uncharacterized protein n=1 Tax=Engelhardtia mirabilis TaxID=2528011 RepID=A0A518BR79_9BACT|nr:hypothetical protein Pla133_46070 [Planctomycetes bacterium Pla133]QDV03813.1 hypothetical protein Pla86_46050 [Planctomycetes bacterium Pla86]